jgi:hypothetical protein
MEDDQHIRDQYTDLHANDLKAQIRERGLPAVKPLKGKRAPANIALRNALREDDLRRAGGQIPMQFGGQPPLQPQDQQGFLQPAPVQPGAPMGGLQHGFGQQAGGVQPSMQQGPGVQPQGLQGAGGTSQPQGFQGGTVQPYPQPGMLPPYQHAYPQQLQQGVGVQSQGVFQPNVFPGGSYIHTGFQPTMQQQYVGSQGPSFLGPSFGGSMGYYAAAPPPYQSYQQPFGVPGPGVMPPQFQLPVTHPARLGPGSVPRSQQVDAYMYVDSGENGGGQAGAGRQDSGMQQHVGQGSQAPAGQGYNPSVQFQQWQREQGLSPGQQQQQGSTRGLSLEQYRDSQHDASSSESSSSRSRKAPRRGQGDEDDEVVEVQPVKATLMQFASPLLANPGGLRSKAGSKGSGEEVSTAPRFAKELRGSAGGSGGVPEANTEIFAQCVAQAADLVALELVRDHAIGGGLQGAENTLIAREATVCMSVCQVLGHMAALPMSLLEIKRDVGDATLKRQLQLAINEFATDLTKLLTVVAISASERSAAKDKGSFTGVTLPPATRSAYLRLEGAEGSIFQQVKNTVSSQVMALGGQPVAARDVPLASTAKCWLSHKALVAGMAEHIQLVDPVPTEAAPAQQGGGRGGATGGGRGGRGGGATGDNGYQRTCYSCGQLGHMSRSRACPNYGQDFGPYQQSGRSNGDGNWRHDGRKTEREREMERNERGEQYRGSDRNRHRSASPLPNRKAIAEGAKQP